MTFSIEVAGQVFTRWETAQVSRSLDHNTGTFAFTNSSLLPAVYPVRVGDPVRVFVNGKSQVRGYVDAVTAEGSTQSHIVTVSGRDNTADLIDSSIPDGAKNVTGSVTLKALAEQIIAALGATVRVTDTTGLRNVLSESQVDGTDGETAMSHLSSYARKLQVYLIADGNGALEIFRPGGQRAATPLTHVSGGQGNTVTTWKFVENHQGRYNKYTCRSQDDFGFDPFADYSAEGTAREGRVTDAAVRTGRYLEVKAEETMNDTVCGNRAEEEANLRRARSTEYTATLAGAVDFSPGDIVTVKDDFAALSGDFLVRSIKYSVDLRSGTQTFVTIAPIDAYTVQGVETPGNKRKSKRGSNLVNDSAPL